jgi:ATP-dependent exoDNAse (exonuclease V) beta subunit
MVPMEEFEGYKFKGFVDLVIKTPDDKYHIIDWKTCGWGWDSRKRSDPMVTYQLTLYKHYFAKKHNMTPRTLRHTLLF